MYTKISRLEIKNITKCANCDYLAIDGDTHKSTLTYIFAKLLHR
jgi:hypothetical protein